MQDAGCRVQGAGCRVQGTGCRISLVNREHTALIDSSAFLYKLSCHERASSVVNCKCAYAKTYDSTTRLK